MTDLYLYIFLAIIGIFVFSTIIFSIVIERKKQRNNKLYFSKEMLISYEKKLAQFYTENGICGVESIEDFCERIGYKIEETEDIDKKKEAKIDKAEEKIIFVDKNLSYNQKNFAIAHETAHIIRKSSLPATRDRHSIFSRSPEEQICDYLAAAILLPRAQMEDRLNKFGFTKKTRKEKLTFIRNISDEKNVEEEVVARRICEVLKIANEINSKSLEMETL